MATVEEVRQPVRSLPLWRTLREAFLLIWDYRWLFGRLLIIPVALTTLLSLVTFYWPGGKGKSLWALVEPLTNLLIFVFFAISCHRLILIGEHSVPRWGVQRWSWRETRFILCLIAIVVAIYLMSAVLGFVAGIFLTPLERLMSKTGAIVAAYMLGGLGAACMSYLIARLSLSLPAVAVDHQPAIEAAWSQSDGNGWRVTALATESLPC